MSSAFLNARHAIVERHGKNGIRLVVDVIRRLNAPVEATALRVALRDVGVWFSDDDFQAMVSQSATDGVALSVDAFVRCLIGDLPSRRKNVLQILWERLDKERRGFVETDAFLAAYDVTRHPDVTSNRRQPSDVANDFYELFADATARGIVTKEEVFAYYSGVSLRIDRTEDFELLIMRSFSLDRPRELFAADGPAKNLTHTSTQGRVHPLYQTSANMVGANCDKATGVTKAFNRTGEFTKHAPPFVGATTLNTSVTRPRV